MYGRSRSGATKMRNTKAVHPDTKIKIIKYVQDGGVLLEASKHFNISISTVYKILKAKGIPYLTKRKLDKIEVENYIKENPNQYLSEYARHFNISPPGMHQFLNRHGIKYKILWNNKKEE